MKGQTCNAKAPHNTGKKGEFRRNKEDGNEDEFSIFGGCNFQERSWQEKKFSSSSSVLLLKFNRDLIDLVKKYYLLLKNVLILTSAGGELKTELIELRYPYETKGNICRSPIAEAVFAHLAKEKGVINEWMIDSAATGDWHIGKKPDKRAIACMEKYVIEMNHRARQLCEDDFEKFDYIFGMDNNNIEDIKDFAPSKSYKAKIELLGSYDPKNELIIRDPYYDSGSEGFEVVYQQCMRCCKSFLDRQ